MTSLERKNKTEGFLKSLHIPYIDHLPSIEEEDEVKVRTPQDIAKRILILVYLNLVAEDKDSRTEVIAFLKKFKLWEYTSLEEKEFFQRDLTKSEQINISWRSEAIWLMLWVINKVEKLELPDNEIDVADIMERIPDFMSDPNKFIESASIRSDSEILDMSDLVYRLHWAVRHSELNNSQTPNLNSNVLSERHYAINWITYYSEDWDEITTDT